CSCSAPGLLLTPVRTPAPLLLFAPTPVLLFVAFSVLLFAPRPAPYSCSSPALLLLFALLPSSCSLPSPRSCPLSGGCGTRPPGGSPMPPKHRPASVAPLALPPPAGRPGAQQRPNQDTPPPRSTQKPPLHGTHWMAITGKPLGAAAGAMIFQQGGNAIDAACAMLAAVATMWDTLGWGGETQALIYNPKTKKVIGINALGVAPPGAPPAYHKSQGYNYPPEYGPLAAITPGTPGGLMTMLAEYGTMSLAQVLAPAIQMADGYAIEAQAANSLERQKAEIKK